MELRINLRATYPAHKKPFLGVAWKTFFAIGILTSGYCAFVLFDARIYQLYEGWRFERAAAGIKTSQVIVELTRPTPPSSSLAPSPANTIRPRPSSKPGEAIGQIGIASIGLKAIIAEGVDDRTLQRAVGHIPGTPWPGQAGNVAMAGHRDTFFRRLRNIKKNDEITLTTLDGSYHYLVDVIELVEPDNTEVLDHSSEPTLTLVTCFPFYYVGPAPERFIVRAHRIDGNVW